MSDISKSVNTLWDTYNSSIDDKDFFVSCGILGFILFGISMIFVLYIIVRIIIVLTRKGQFKKMHGTIPEYTDDTIIGNTQPKAKLAVLPK